MLLVFLYVIVFNINFNVMKNRKYDVEMEHNGTVNDSIYGN